MKKTRKWIAMLLASFSLLSLSAFAVGCGEDATAPTPTPPPVDNVNWGEWELVKEPTCTVVGEKKRTEIGNPDNVQYAPIAARHHQYAEDYDDLSGTQATSMGDCVRCGESAVIPPLANNASYPVIELCTHSEQDVAYGICKCKGKGTPWNRLELNEGTYTVKVAANGETWLSFSVKSAGQYVLYSVDGTTDFTIERFNANAHFIPTDPSTGDYSGFAGLQKSGNFYSYVHCGEGYFNREWRATYRLKGTADAAVKIRFVKIDEPAWQPKSVRSFVYPTEINGQKAPENSDPTLKAVDVPYDTSYFYSDPATGGDGYYHTGTPANPGEIIYAAITKPATRIFGSEDTSFANFILAEDVLPTAFSVNDGFTVEGDFNTLSYIPFIMNCADDSDPKNQDSPDLTKNCYQNFCNSDGMYPVNKELYKFLNLYVRANKPIDAELSNEVWMQDQKRELDDPNNSAWLAGCYIYKATKLGTADNPQPLTVGSQSITLPRGFYYAKFEGDGVYTLECTNEGVDLNIGKTTMISSPFKVTISSPITLRLSKGATTTETAELIVSKAQGVSNGETEDKEMQPILLTTSGEHTLNTIAVYGAGDSIEHYAYYAFTPDEDGEITIALTGETDATVTVNGVLLNKGTLTFSAVTLAENQTLGENEIETGTPLIIYLSASSAASASITIS